MTVAPDLIQPSGQSKPQSLHAFETKRCGCRLPKPLDGSLHGLWGFTSQH